MADLWGFFVYILLTYLKLSFSTSNSVFPRGSADVPEEDVPYVTAMFFSR